MKRKKVDVPMAVDSSDSGQDGGQLVNPFMRVTKYMTRNEKFGYIESVIGTPAVYPRLCKFHHIDIQSTKQKSHCVNTT